MEEEGADVTKVVAAEVQVGIKSIRYRAAKCAQLSSPGRGSLFKRGEHLASISGIVAEWPSQMTMQAREGRTASQPPMGYT